MTGAIATFGFIIFFNISLTLKGIKVNHLSCLLKCISEKNGRGWGEPSFKVFLGGKGEEKLRR